MIYHKRTEHFDEKPFSCDDCGAKFGANSSLKNHMRLHTGEKPYQCKHCDMSFSVAAALAYHTKKKHSEGKTLTHARTYKLGHFVDIYSHLTLTLSDPCPALTPPLTWPIHKSLLQSHPGSFPTLGPVIWSSEGPVDLTITCTHTQTCEVTKKMF